MSKAPEIVCNSEFIDCEMIKKWLTDFTITNAKYIFVEDSDKLITRFNGDEEVEYDFREAGYLAKTRERDSDYPQILVAPDLIWNKSSEVSIEDQIIISVLHEENHLCGIKSERKAEMLAYQRYKTQSKSFAPRLHLIK